jgi:hypothetical protein
MSWIIALAMSVRFVCDAIRRELTSYVRSLTPKSMTAGASVFLGSFLYVIVTGLVAHAIR